MEINFDGLRKRLIIDYNLLTEKLNREITTDEFGEKEIRIYPEYIQNQMDGLRSGLIALAFTYQKGDDGFNCLDEDTHFEKYNSEIEK